MIPNAKRSTVSEQHPEQSAALILSLELFFIFKHKCLSWKRLLGVSSSLQAAGIQPTPLLPLETFRPLIENCVEPL